MGKASCQFNSVQFYHQRSSDTQKKIKYPKPLIYLSLGLSSSYRGSRILFQIPKEKITTMSLSHKPPFLQMPYLQSNWNKDGIMTDTTSGWQELTSWDFPNGSLSQDVIHMSPETRQCYFPFSSLLPRAPRTAPLLAFAGNYNVSSASLKRLLQSLPNKSITPKDFPLSLSDFNSFLNIYFNSFITYTVTEE